MVVDEDELNKVIGVKEKKVKEIKKEVVDVMTSKHITDGIMEASKYLNEVEGLPLEQRKTVFDIADGVLTNIKAFVSDPVAWKKINDYEERTHKEFSKRVGEAREKLKNKDPLYQWQDGIAYMMDLRLWKTREMIAFWDKLSKEHDL